MSEEFALNKVCVVKHQEVDRRLGTMDEYIEEARTHREQLLLCVKSSQNELKEAMNKKFNKIMFLVFGALVALLFDIARGLVVLERVSKW